MSFVTLIFMISFISLFSLQLFVVLFSLLLLFFNWMSVVNASGS